MFTCGISGLKVEDGRGGNILYIASHDQELISKVRNSSHLGLRQQRERKLKIETISRLIIYKSS